MNLRSAVRVQDHKGTLPNQGVILGITSTVSAFIEVADLGLVDSRGDAQLVLAVSVDAILRRAVALQKRLAQLGLLKIRRTAKLCLRVRVMANTDKQSRASSETKQ